MIEHDKNMVKIICDQCGKSDQAKKNMHHDVFHFLGWALLRKSNRSIHLCEKCRLNVADARDSGH